jgi:hypothetical protein
VQKAHSSLIASQVASHYRLSRGCTDVSEETMNSFLLVKKEYRKHQNVFIILCCMWSNVIHRGWLSLRTHGKSIKHNSLLLELSTLSFLSLVQKFLDVILSCVAMMEVW